MAALTVDWTSTFGWIAAIAAMPVGVALGAWASRRQSAGAAERLERIESYFLPKRRMTFRDEEDTDGEVVERPSPFEESLMKRTLNGAPGLVMIKQRVLVDLAIKDPSLKHELNDLKERGDGRWLGQLVEKVVSHPGRARELVELRNKYASRGWNMVCIEPAYDTSEGLCVWVELEKGLNLLPSDRRVA